MDNLNNSKTETVIVPSHAKGERTDSFLSDRYPGISRGYIQKCIADNRVIISGRSAASSFRLHGNERIEIHWPPPENNSVTPEPVAFEIIFEDEDILVLNKPPGIVVHPNDHNKSGTLVHGLLYHNRAVFEPMLDAEKRPGIVHRLDKDTSGVIITAKTEDAWYKLKADFKNRNVEKVYLAVVCGRLEREEGRIEKSIGRHPVKRKKMAVLNEDGKSAVTNYRVLAAGGGLSLLKVKIETGRTHQIRVHFADAQHPILGDPIYGGKRKIEGLTVPRQMLHAWKLTIPHPRTNALCEYVASIPQDIQIILNYVQDTSD